MTMAVKWTTAAAALLLCVDAAPSHAQLKNENLLFSPPTGFKVGFQDSRNGVRLQEWVPSNETVQDWSEMVTVQIFINRGDLDPAKVLGDIAQRWGTACKGSTGEAVAATRVNGYGAATMMLRCPLNGQTGKPETTVFRAVQGADSLYLVQRAVRALPGPDKLQQMKAYLATMSVCDTRAPAHPCPALTPIDRK